MRYGLTIGVAFWAVPLATLPLWVVGVIALMLAAFVAWVFVADARYSPSVIMYRRRA